MMLTSRSIIDNITVAASSDRGFPLHPVKAAGRIRFSETGRMGYGRKYSRFQRLKGEKQTLWPHQETCPLDRLQDIEGRHIINASEIRLHKYITVRIAETSPLESFK